MSRARTVPVLAVLGTVLLTVGLAACGGGKSKSGPPPASTAAPSATAMPTPTPTPTTPAPTKKPAAAVNPLTGVGAPNNNPVVAVKIDDTANGRPQVGLDKANIVYIEEAEGGLSRMVAIFNTSFPTVEPVRSTRASDPELLAQYGPIDYVASGGGGNTLQVLDASPLKSTINDRGGPGFSRDDNREAPYNLMSNLTTVTQSLHGAKAKSIGWTWASTLSSVASVAAPKVTTVVGSTGIEFDWNAKLGEYERVIDGQVQHAADGAVIATPNVIVQFCTVTPYPGDIDVNGNPSQYTHSIGRGQVAVFRNGREYTGVWTRASATVGTTLRATDGTTISLAPGGAWVVLANTGAPLGR